MMANVALTGHKSNHHNQMDEDVEDVDLLEQVQRSHRDSPRAAAPLGPGWE